MEISKRRLIRQLIQSGTRVGRVIDPHAYTQLFLNGLVALNDNQIGSTMLTEKGERLLQELEATWENQT